MNFKTLLLAFICLLLALPFAGNHLYAGEQNNKKSIDTFRTGPELFEFDPFLMQNAPGGLFYTFFLENYAPDTTFLIEENNAFSMIDNPRVYFEGDSFINFNWFYNGLNINSGLNDGSPGVLLPFSAVNRYRLQGESPLLKDYGMNFISDLPRRSFSQATASAVLSDLGGYWMTFMIQPDHPSTRADRLYNERRKIDNNFFLDYIYNKSSRRSQFSFAVNYFDIQRQFNDFNTFDNTYTESGKMVLLNSRLKKDLNNGYYELTGTFNYLDRSNQQAETAVYPQETLDRERVSFLAGFRLKKRLNLSISLLVEKEDLSPFAENFSRELADTDGDLSLPYGKTSDYRFGTFSAATFDVNLFYPVYAPSGGKGLHVSAFGDFRYTAISGEEGNHDYNALFFNKEPWQVVLWNPGSDYNNSNIQAKAGLNLSAGIGDNIRLMAKALVAINRLNFDYSANNMNFVTPGFDLGIQVNFSKRKRSNLLFSIGRLPYHIRENSNFFLEQNRPSGSLHQWNDSNGNSTFQEGEEGSLIGNTGGNQHFLDENISAPVKERLLLNFSTRISRNFTLNIKAIYKKIKNNLRVRFDREYGFYESHQDKDFYFFNQPYGNYYLGSGGYEKDPFYAQFHFNFKGRRQNKWFFSFSFMAHMGMGETAYGNGPSSNDIGILDESQANPNSWINGFGRVDGDRGFVAKGYLGYYIARRLFFSLSLKYRDGNPFAFFNTLDRHDQRIVYYSTIKAENEKGVKGGPREDYVSDLSVTLNYRFKLLKRDAFVSLTMFNLLDFGGELSEYVYSGGKRDSVELQIPRSLRLTLGWRF